MKKYTIERILYQWLKGKGLLDEFCDEIERQQGIAAGEYDSIALAFTWNSSRKGKEYWNDIADEYRIHLNAVRSPKPRTQIKF